MLKPITDYLTQPVQDRVQFSDFHSRPFTAFLRQAVHLWDAFNHCVRHFERKPVHTQDYTKDSVHSMQEIASPLLAALMSNLELFQRSVYAQLFDLTTHIPDFSPEDLLENLRKANVEVSLRHLIGYRGNEAAAGGIVADALTAWHSPEKVNQYFKALLNVEPFYPEDSVAEIEELWQLRHSIVHTGGTLTIPDAQKVSSLAPYAGRPVVFTHLAIDRVVRRLHRVLKAARDGFYPKVVGRFGQAYAGGVKRRLNKLFELDSPRRSWLA